MVGIIPISAIVASSISTIALLIVYIIKLIKIKRNNKFLSNKCNYQTFGTLVLKDKWWNNEYNKHLYYDFCTKNGLENNNHLCMKYHIEGKDYFYIIDNLTDYFNKEKYFKDINKLFKKKLKISVNRQNPDKCIHSNDIFKLNKKITTKYFFKKIIHEASKYIAIYTLMYYLVAFIFSFFK